jgi:adenosylcobinamide kinase/adenosylcobinamide-phosphate guanylyltransferase
MADIILITGGTRSGKSDYAQIRAEQLSGPHCFIATCKAVDQEMIERIKKHQLQRDNQKWTTLEEPLELVRLLRQNPFWGCYLVDCLTLWISNLMHAYAQKGIDCTEDTIAVELEELVHECTLVNGTIIFVTNEIGLGIVPENKLARQFRDIVGYANRILASHADEVILVSCGLPLPLKSKQSGK